MHTKCAPKATRLPLYLFVSARLHTHTYRGHTQTCFYGICSSALLVAFVAVSCGAFFFYTAVCCLPHCAICVCVDYFCMPLCVLCCVRVWSSILSRWAKRAKHQHGYFCFAMFICLLQPRQLHMTDKCGPGCVYVCDDNSQAVLCNA